jgi:hypothetical protein
MAGSCSTGPARVRPVLTKTANSSDRIPNVAIGGLTRNSAQNGTAFAWTQNPRQTISAVAYFGLSESRSPECCLDPYSILESGSEGR